MAASAATRALRRRGTSRAARPSSVSRTRSAIVVFLISLSPAAVLVMLLVGRPKGARNVNESRKCGVHTSSTIAGYHADRGPGTLRPPAAEAVPGDRRRDRGADARELPGLHVDLRARLRAVRQPRGRRPAGADDRP